MVSLLPLYYMIRPRVGNPAEFGVYVGRAPDTGPRHIRVRLVQRDGTSIMPGRDMNAVVLKDDCIPVRMVKGILQP